MEALDNLALAATADKGMMDDLIVSNRKLTEASEHMTAQIKVLTETNAKLVGKLGNKGGGGGGGDTNRGGYQFIRQRLDWKGYYWSQGFNMVKGHDRKMCTAKNPDHKDEVNCTNTMGGIQNNNEWEPNRLWLGEANNQNNTIEMLNYTGYKHRLHNSNTKSRAHFMNLAAATVIADTRLTSTYLKTRHPHDNTEQKGVPITVGMSDGGRLTSL